MYLKQYEVKSKLKKDSEEHFRKLQSLCTSVKTTTSGRDVVFYMKMISLSAMLNSETYIPICMSYKIPEVK